MWEEVLAKKLQLDHFQELNQTHNQKSISKLASLSLYMDNFICSFSPF